MLAQSLEGPPCPLKFGRRPVHFDLSVFDGQSAVGAADRAGYIRTGTLDGEQSLVADRADAVSVLGVVIFDLGFVFSVCLRRPLPDLMHMLNELILEVGVADRTHAVGIVVGNHIHHGGEAEDMEGTGSHGSPVLGTGSAYGNVGNGLHPEPLLREIIRVARHLAAAPLIQHPVDGGSVMTAGIAVHKILELADRLQSVYRRCKNNSVRPADPVFYHLEIILHHALIVFSMFQSL